jgi:hypothetical protein
MLLYNYNNLGFYNTKLFYCLTYIVYTYILNPDYIYRFAAISAAAAAAIIVV